jgi:hypothetical protein
MIVAIRTPVSSDTLLRNAENCSVGALQALGSCVDLAGRQTAQIFCERRNCEAPEGKFLLPSAILGSHSALGLAWYDAQAQALVFTTWQTPAVATWQAQA